MLIDALPVAFLAIHCAELHPIHNTTQSTGSSLAAAPSVPAPIDREALKRELEADQRVDMREFAMQLIAGGAAAAGQLSKEEMQQLERAYRTAGLDLQALMKQVRNILAGLSVHA